MRFIAVVALIAAAPLSHARLTSASPQLALPPRMAAYSQAYVSRLINHFQIGKLGSTAVRDLAAAAWSLLSFSAPTAPSDINITLAANMIDACFAKQLPDGQFPWSFDESTATDANSVQFTALPLLRTLVHYGDRFGATMQKWMPNVSMAAVASFAEGDGPRTEAQPYYTNIATMRLVNLHLFAQVTGNASLRTQADAATTAWTTLVDGAGLHEYASPTYSAVTIANLVGGAASVSDAAIAGTLRRYARYLIAYSAAVYWAPAQAVGGAHSRDYDFLFGSAGMDWMCELHDST